MVRRKEKRVLPSPQGGEPRRAEGSLGALAGLLAWKETDDLGVVLGSVDVVRATWRRNHVEQFGVPLEDLARARITLEGEQLAPELTSQDDWGSPLATCLGHRDRGPRTLSPPRAHERGNGARSNQWLIAEQHDGRCDLIAHRAQANLQGGRHSSARLRVMDQLRPSIDGVAHIVSRVDDDDLVTAPLRGGLHRVTDHGLAVELQQQLLRAGHARARAGGEDDRTDWQQCRSQALVRRSRRANPLDLDAGADRAFRKLAEALVIAIDQQQAAAGH